MDIYFTILIVSTVIVVVPVVVLLIKYFKQPKEARILGQHKVSHSRINAMVFLILGGGQLFSWYSGVANKFALYIGILFLLFGIYRLLTSWGKNDS